MKILTSLSHVTVRLLCVRTGFVDLRLTVKRVVGIACWSVQLAVRRVGKHRSPGKADQCSATCQRRGWLTAGVIPTGWNLVHLGSAGVILQARWIARRRTWSRMVGCGRRIGRSVLRASLRGWIPRVLGVPGVPRSSRVSAPRRPSPRPLDRCASHEARSANGGLRRVASGGESELHGRSANNGKNRTAHRSAHTRPQHPSTLAPSGIP